MLAIKMCANILRYFNSGNFTKFHINSFVCSESILYIELNYYQIKLVLGILGQLFLVEYRRMANFIVTWRRCVDSTQWLSLLILDWSSL